MKVGRITFAPAGNKELTDLDDKKVHAVYDNPEAEIVAALTQFARNIKVMEADTVMLEDGFQISSKAIGIAKRRIMAAVAK